MTKVFEVLETDESGYTGDEKLFKTINAAKKEYNSRKKRYKKSIDIEEDEPILYLNSEANKGRGRKQHTLFLVIDEEGEKTYVNLSLVERRVY